MAKRNLVVVESAAKAKTIEKFLGRDYKVVASYGHVRDLPKSKLGVDVEHGFEPTYVVPPDKKDVVKRLKDEGKKADAIYLATDPDREGEAIAWHVVEAAGLKGKPIHRIEFHEEPARDRHRARRCPAGPPCPGPTGRLSDQPAALAQSPPWPLGRAGPVRGRAAGGGPRARARRFRARRVLVH
jgi:hypothetical protein